MTRSAFVAVCRKIYHRVTGVLKKYELLFATLVVVYTVYDSLRSYSYMSGETAKLVEQLVAIRDSAGARDSTLVVRLESIIKEQEGFIAEMGRLRADQRGYQMEVVASGDRLADGTMVLSNHLVAMNKAIAGDGNAGGTSLVAILDAMMKQSDKQTERMLGTWRLMNDSLTTLLQRESAILGQIKTNVERPKIELSMRDPQTRKNDYCDVGAACDQLFWSMTNAVSLNEDYSIRFEYRVMNMVPRRVLLSIPNIQQGSVPITTDQVILTPDSVIAVKIGDQVLAPFRWYPGMKTYELDVPAGVVEIVLRRRHAAIVSAVSTEAESGRELSARLLMRMECTASVENKPEVVRRIAYGHATVNLSLLPAIVLKSLFNHIGV